MKRILFFMLMLVTVAAIAQKQPKPNINKALKAWQEGKLDEAKQIIDAATTYEKTMDDGKTWYYRGLIYTSLDTTSNESFKALATDPLNVAVESFVKADQLGKADSEYFLTDANTMMPVTKSQQLEMLANYYLDKGIKKFQDEGDNQASLEALEKSKIVFEKGGMSAYANDTLAYYVTALVAQQDDNADLAVENLNKYFDKGGKSRDGYVLLYQIYASGPHEDKEKALEVVRKAKAALPSDPDFAKLEIGLLIDLNRIEEAKKGLEDAVAKEPDNKLLHFYLGFANSQMALAERKIADSLSGSGKNQQANVEKINAHRSSETKLLEEARKNYENALKIDPAYFDAQFYLADTYLVAVDKTSKELSATGNTPADSKKRSALVQRRVKESETAIPYVEKAEKMKAPDKESEIDVLQKLSLLYYYIADDKNSARIANKLKALGVEE